MPPLLILALMAVSLLLGPAAFILLWILRRKTDEESLGPLAMSVLGLCLIMLGNGATLVMDVFLRIRDARAFFLGMNWVFLATVLTVGSFARFACACAGRPITAAKRTAFWGFTVAFFFLVISLPIYVGRSLDTGVGYLSSTCYGAIVLAWSTAVILRGRPRIPAIYGRAFPVFSITLLVLALASVANDVFKFGLLLGGAMFPFSPFLFMFISGGVIVFAASALTKGQPVGNARPAAAYEPEFEEALSSREKEMLPLLLEGLSNEEIGRRLFISPHTVKNHVTSIFRKAGVANRYELLSRAGSGGHPEAHS